MKSIEQVAAEIAAEIRENGHFQDPAGTGVEVGNRCCVILNPGWESLQFDGEKYCSYEEYSFRSNDLLDRIGIASGISLSHRLEDLYRWNDNTPTEQVLAKLDEIAAGA